MVSFEKLYRNVKSMEMSSETRDLLKSRMKDWAISSFEIYNSSKKPKNLSDEELEALFSLANNLDLVIQKSDKGNSVVLVDKDIYVNKISDILNDTAKFAKVKCDKEKELNFIINQEKKVTAVLKTLLDNGSLERRLHEKLKPTGSKLGILYGLCKIHKSIVNGSPPFRPILSAIDTPTYNLAKFLVPLLAPLTVNEYTVFSSFSFAEEISKQDSSLFMASLDVDSLFTNIPLQETIDICTDSLFSETDPVGNFCKSDFRKLLSLATENSYFTFDGQLFKQVDGVAMGSPLGPSLANAFLSHHEKTWLDNCPSSLKPVYYRRYVDDVFVLFSSPSHLPLFKDYLNRQHINISFTSECEADKTLPFLDVSVSRNESKFVTSIYRKPTFSGVYTNYNSFLPEEYKTGLIMTLIFRIFKIVSDFSRFHLEMQDLRNILLRNGYPSSLIDQCIKSFLDRMFQDKKVFSTVPKSEVLIILPYLGNISLKLRTHLVKTFDKHLPCCKLRVIFKSGCRIGNFFRFKDRVSKALRSKVVYKYQCDGCNAIYYGKTMRHLKVRACEHMAVSALTGKSVKSINPSAVLEHVVFCKNRPSLDNFSIISSASNNFDLELKESLLILPKCIDNYYSLSLPKVRQSENKIATFLKETCPGMYFNIKEL
ncbi:uncharacterized protein LOC130636990 [Hydractinia symbiolongicarpus]|uniref:uncharacterized protein LOC130636990 n=1 Tax=Hydractinia symbiolongicarpus TaxID=13093 RepID=UPI00254DD2B2|nr:uncharacterized protein LOC130636990 [Hydractinia symbiolongicarpus]